MDEGARKRFLEMKTKADSTFERKEDTRKLESFQKLARVQGAVQRAATENLLGNLEAGQPLIPVSSIRNRPGSKVALGRTRGMKRKSRSNGVGGPGIS